MPLMYENPAHANGPAAHALVIGVGAYAHLTGGPGALCPNHEGMGQLTSPPVSAMAFADWLRFQYRNPNKPLASIDLLMSDGAGVGPPAPSGAYAGRACMNNVKKAVFDWVARGNTNSENLMIWYFCGHGIASGGEMALLLEDYGETPVAVLENAIYFQGFYQGMDQCVARQQVFIVDACRSMSRTLSDCDDYYGNPIITPLRGQEGQRLAPIYYSTLVGDRAYGRLGAPSLFTEAVLRALEGAGSDDVEGDWRVDTVTLHRGISCLVDLARSEADKLDQVPSIDKLAQFTVHHLPWTPRVPVEIGCEPSEATGCAQLSWRCGGTVMVRPDIQPSKWRTDVEEGNYIFAADFPTGAYTRGQKSRYVRPPYRPVSIEVGK